MAQKRHADLDGSTILKTVESRDAAHPIIALAVVGMVICGVAFGLPSISGNSDSGELIESSTESTDHQDDASDDDNDEVLYVDVAGAVQTPGVVKLSEGARIDDALSAAGGLSDDADVSQLNRASKATDGLKVYVPRVGEAGNPTVAVPSSSENSTPSSSGLVSINAGSQSDLETLPGIGPSTSQAIIDDRTQNGPFTSLEDLMRVSGIGEKKFEKMKDSISL